MGKNIAYKELAIIQEETATVEDARFNIQTCYNCHHWDFLRPVKYAPTGGANDFRWCKLYPFRVAGWQQWCSDYSGDAPAPNYSAKYHNWFGDDDGA